MFYLQYASNEIETHRSDRIGNFLIYFILNNFLLLFFSDKILYEFAMYKLYVYFTFKTFLTAATISLACGRAAASNDTAYGIGTSAPTKKCQDIESFQCFLLLLQN